MIMATIKQQIATKKVLNGVPVSRAMKEAGYAVSTSNSTSKLTSTKGFTELIQKELDDKMLLKVHKEGLKAGKKIFKNNNATGEIEEVGFEPDYAVRHKYLETAYKVRDMMPKSNPFTAVQVNFGEDREKYV